MSAGKELSNNSRADNYKGVQKTTDTGSHFIQPNSQSIQQLNSIFSITCFTHD